MIKVDIKIKDDKYLRMKGVTSTINHVIFFTPIFYSSSDNR
jgi:hypothetical protein